MANTSYIKGLERFMSGAINLLGDDIKVVGVDTDVYTLNAATHEFLSDIPSGARIATSGNLAGKVVTGGVFDADNITIPSVAGGTGITVNALVIYKDTSVTNTSPLILWLDSGTGFPFTPNGGNLTINWSDGANKIFKFGA